MRGGIGGIPSDYHDHDRWQILRARDLELGTLAHQQIRLLLRGIAVFLKTVRGVGDGFKRGYRSVQNASETRKDGLQIHFK